MSRKLEITFSEDDDLPDRSMPEGGWEKACTIADHKWALGIEEGRAFLECLDPHPESFMNEVDPARGMPVCIDSYWEREDLGTSKPIPVHVEHVDDSTPSTPAGPAEYGFYIEIKEVSE